MPRARLHLSIHGIVQGVGFRPFIHRLASRLALSGSVRNSTGSVEIVAEGESLALEEFLSLLRSEAPPLAVILRLESSTHPPLGLSGFHILTSDTTSAPSSPIPPDIATCDDCLHELHNPNDRRFRYPFLNCTNCGPRFTIIRGLPYDRPLTTMAPFAMCPACAAEYHDPLNRRFHAQPTACPACGPRLEFQAPGQPSLFRDDALSAALNALSHGRILAVKGLGGFHLACLASNEDAVAELRRRKRRSLKPLAVMVPDLAAARRHALLSDDEARILASPRRPILLLPRGPEPLAPSVAPAQRHLGLLLPYTPLHALLIEAGPLVMTSGNLSDEPIARTNAEALARLATLADAFLLHDREIETVCDDSVLRAFSSSELPIRRSRGYTPFPIPLPVEAPPLLAVGAELKNTFCLANSRHAFLSQHIGDLGNLETLDAFERALAHMQSLFRIQPETVVCDPHPAYLGTAWARRSGLPVLEVQHHHAHIAAVMAEANLPPDAQVIGVAWDGTGYGEDGTIWGGEFFTGGYASFHRAAYLRPFQLPGGDAAIRKPYRAALALLHSAGIPWSPGLAPVRACPPAELEILRHQLEHNLNTTPCSSAGRWFDALASLCGFCHEAGYEAQAAMELEAAAESTPLPPYPCELDPAPLLHAILEDLHSATPPGIISTRIHAGLAALIVRTCESLRDSSGLNTVALGGGVFQNVTLLRLTVDALRASGFEPLWPRLVPPNDGGLALGQAAIAAVRLQAN